MAFKLGSFSVREIIYGIAENSKGDPLFTLDQLSNANIEVSSDPTEITDKNGNVIKTIYKSKSATFSASSALLSPNIMNAASGSEIEVASSSAPLTAPKVALVPAGKTLDVTDAITGTVTMIGLFNNGANGKAYDYTETLALISGGILTAPAAADDEPVQYLVKYQRNLESGMKLSNTGNKFPDSMALTLYVAIDDPCEKEGCRAAYVVIPNFQADPSTTIAFDSESTETDFSGNIQVDFCSCDKALYYIYFADENAVMTAACA